MDLIYREEVYGLVGALTDEHRAQVHNYLKATSFKVGLLVNFGKAKDLEYERIVR